MIKQLGIGLIGAWGFRGILAGYARDADKNVRIIGAADIHDDSLEAFRDSYGRELFTTNDYRELLKLDSIDAIMIISPDYMHEEHAVAALEAGKSVYLEKPLAISIEGCDRILDTAFRTGSKLFLGHNMRYFPSVLKMKEIIDSGVIGEVQAIWCRHFVSYGGDAYFKDWHSERKNINGLLLQKGAHDIDVIHWLAGGYSHRVVGMGKLSVYNQCKNPREADDRSPVEFKDTNWPPLSQEGLSPVIDVEDHSMMLMTLDNNVQASYMQCHYTPDSTRNYTVIGTRGRLENIGDTGRCRIEVHTTRSQGCKEPDQVHELYPLEGTHGGSDPIIVKSFIYFIRRGKQPNTSPVAAREAVAAGVCATESIRNSSSPRTVCKLPEQIVDYFANGQKK